MPNKRHVLMVSVAGAILVGVLLTRAAVVLAEPPADAALEKVSAAACMPNAKDYTLLGWAYGWRGQSPDAERVLTLQTGHYGMAMDVGHARLLTLGPIVDGTSYLAAAAAPNDDVLDLPPAELAIEASVDKTRYHVARGRFSSRTIESGRFFQRFDIEGITLDDDQGNKLPGAARLEVAAWPDRLAIVLDFTPRQNLAQASLGLALRSFGKNIESGGVPGDWKAGQTERRVVVWGRAGGASDTASVPVAVDLDGGRPVAVQIEPELGCYRVDLPKKDWHANADFDHLERVRLELRNPDARPRTVRLLLAKDYAFEGITGLSPMLRDADGEPTGIPIQLSKNWHRKQGEHLLYEGPWFHGLTMLRLPPRSRLQCEATIAFDRWGGVPAASHAQLCLVGWGTDQLWDQAAVGSWGESICYEPDVTQRRGMIDDVRPLMVWAMNQDHGKWNWTQNVGGGDFLVLHDTDGQRQYLARMKTAYVAQCPCLTEVTYAGTTPDGAIDAQITVSTPRTDDYVRAFHRFRYDVRKAVGFSRLAFYQLGADHYNDAPVREMARGNAAGMIDAWQPPAELPKTAQYVRTGLSCDGRLPWASLHHALRRDEKGGALANRGLIVRSWKARLGGREVAAPSMASFRTIGERGNVNVELTPPPNLHELQPGDFVEAEVELVVMPIAADDYYGPNENLRAALKQDGDTWKMIRREAVGNDLVVEVVRGRAIHAYPVHVEADASGRAEFSVTGGIGYVPVIVNGLKRPGGWVLKQTIDGGEKPAATTVYGKECCQADYDAAAGTWRLIYNVSLDSPGDVRRPARFVLE